MYEIPDYAIVFIGCFTGALPPLVVLFFVAFFAVLAMKFIKDVV